MPLIPNHDPIILKGNVLNAVKKIFPAFFSLDTCHLEVWAPRLRSLLLQSLGELNEAVYTASASAVVYPHFFSLLFNEKSFKASLSHFFSKRLQHEIETSQS